MNQRQLVWMIGVLFLTGGVSAANPGESSRAVEKAVRYLKTDGEKWIKRHACVSCHQIPAMVWSLGMASERGIELDKKWLAEQTTWSTDPVSFVKRPQKKDLDVKKTLAGNIDTMAQLLLAIDADSDAEWKKQFIDALVENQAEAGSWKACGQLPFQKRPESETHQVTTLWVVLALLRHGVDDFDLDAAMKFSRAKEATSTEWYAIDLLVAAEHAPKQVDSKQQALIAHQNEDGGWGWLVDEDSDALATGLALYALKRTGTSDSDSLQRATSFLLGSQTASGKWDVLGTKEKTKEEFTATSNYWGTAWAVIGLMSE